MRYLLLGDSHTAGHPGRALEEALVARGHSVVRRGLHGQGIVSWYLRHRDEVQALVAAYRPDRVVLLFGSNDPPDHPAFSEACAWFDALGAHYSGPPGYANARLRPRGARVARAAARVFGWRYVDVWAATDDPSLYLGDGIHLNVAGGHAWAHQVIDVLHGFFWRVAAAVIAGAALFGALWRWG